MSEKSIKVAGALTGSPVALRDGVELGDSDEARYIQLIDHASRQIPFVVPNTSITLADVDERSISKRTITASDTYQIYSLTDGTSALVNSIIRVKDASHVAIWGAVNPSTVSGDATIVITPFIATVTAAGPPMVFAMAAILRPFKAVPIAPLGTYGASLMMETSGGYSFPIEIMPTFGAEYMGFAVHFSSSITDATVWMSQTSMGGRNAYSDELCGSGAWGGFTSWPSI